MRCRPGLWAWVDSAYRRYVTALAHDPTAFRGTLADIPGPAGGFFLGNAMDFRRDLLGHLTTGLHRYGDVVAYPVGPRATPMRITIVVAHHPTDVHTVLAQTERTFTKDTIAFRVMAEMFGDGLLTTEGEEWKRQRRIVQPLFTPRRVEGYAALMAEEAERVTAGAPEDGRTVDAHLLMMEYTLRVVGRALFGDAGESIDHIVDVLDELVPEVSHVTRRRMFRPIQVPIGKPGPGNRYARSLRRRQYAVIDDILSRSPRPGQSSYDGDRDDLVTRLREARDPETGDPISEREIRDQALIFLMAGHETTAGALTFTLHLLGRHPEIQDRVADEIRSILGDDPVASPDQVRRLVLTRAALLEGMRLFPSAHVTERSTSTAVTLGGYALPEDQIVLVSPWTTHRHPEFWPYAEQFDPGRFVGEHDRPRYAYFPFGGGPRSCVGEHFAMLEAVTLLAAFLRRHRVTAQRAELSVMPNITLRPVGLVPLAITRR
jgi:cytochrome P450